MSKESKTLSNPEQEVIKLFLIRVTVLVVLLVLCHGRELCDINVCPGSTFN